jgi:redox-sensitive bicupin YhaK (pirin superfamily)
VERRRQRQMCIRDRGNTISIKATGNLPADVLILGGQKITEPLFFDGPFVMDSNKNMKLTYQNYHQGKMGTLDGVPY